MMGIKDIRNWLRFRLLKKPIVGLWNEVDPRNFAARVIAGEVTEADLSPLPFSNGEVVLMNQGSSDFCVGYSKGYGKQITEGVVMSGAGAFAMGCRALGFVTEWGISILQVMRGAQKYGVPEERLWPLTGNRAHDADWRNMDEAVLNNALSHRDASFFQIVPIAGMDKFDQFRAYLNKLRDRKIVIHTGIDGHAVTLIGQAYHDGELKLFGPDSYGKWNYNYPTGKCVNGYRYFSRAEANRLFDGYISLDMPRALAELLNRYDGKAVKLESLSDCWLIKDGKRHLLKNEAVAWAYGTLLFGEDNVHTLTYDEFNLIPVGEPMPFDGGVNSAIVRRILEKTGRLDLIDEA